MGIEPICIFCKKELNDFGAILISPPNEFDKVRDKIHVCQKCYIKMSELIVGKDERATPLELIDEKELDRVLLKRVYCKEHANNCHHDMVGNMKCPHCNVNYWRNKIVDDCKKAILAHFGTPIEPIDERRIEEVLSKIETPIEESLLEFVQTKNKAIVRLKPKWTTLIAHSISTYFGVSNKLEPLDKIELTKVVKNAGGNLNCETIVADIIAKFGSPKSQ